MLKKVKLNGISKNTPKKIRTFILIGSLVGSCILIPEIKKIKNNSTAEILLEHHFDPAMETYSESYIEEDNGYVKAIDKVIENNDIILCKRFDGYMVLTKEGKFKWIAFDGTEYDDMHELLYSSTITKPSYIEVLSQMENIPASEFAKHYNVETEETRRDVLEQDHFVLTRTSNQINEQGEKYVKQTIFRDGHDGAPVGTAYYIKVGKELVNIFTSLDGEIEATSLKEFSILYDHPELLNQRVK